MEPAYKGISLDDINIKRDIKGGGFFEFQIVGKHEGYEDWRNDSIYLSHLIFDLFEDCFDESHPKFNFFGPTRYEEDNIKTLIKKLNELLDSFKIVNDYGSFKKLIERISHLKKIEGGMPGSPFFLLATERAEVNWEKALTALEKVAVELIGYFQKAIDQDKILWVLGI